MPSMSRFIVLCASLLFVVDALRSEEPRLVVVICVDQFRYDYLVRFDPCFGPGGFRLLLTKGATFVNASYKHAQTSTGPGHAAILSGAYGNSNGIVSNSWYDRVARKRVYCVGDDSTRLIGTTTAGCSPRRFVGSTLGDELRLQSGFRSRVISVSHKDRAAILLGGKFANAAYWMRDSLFTTSTYYRRALPPWVEKFNASGAANRYFGTFWNRALPLPPYDASGPDEAPYEDGADGMGRTFPHRITGSDTSRITRSYYAALLKSPYGNDLLLQFAEAAIEGERLGMRGVSDLLCVSFSGMDYAGHAFGPYSHEILDMAVRTDRVLAAFFTYLEKTIGLRRCVVALTADHGVGPAPEYLQLNVPGADAGRLPSTAIPAAAESALLARYPALSPGTRYIESASAQALYLNDRVLSAAHIPADEAAAVVADALNHHPAVGLALPALLIRTGTHPSPLAAKMSRSFYETRSGDILYVLKPFWLDDGDSLGASHGSPWEGDAHVPLILMGPAIRAGQYTEETSPTDLGPTLSALLGVEFPAGRDGRVLTEALLAPLRPRR